MSNIEKRSELLSGAERRRRHLPGVGHKVLADSEVRLFVYSALETRTFAEIARACLELFGAARAPTKSSVQRYWLALLRSRSPDSPRLPGAKARN